jgi:peptidyl-Lys metalloendopeptidase
MRVWPVIALLGAMVWGQGAVAQQDAQSCDIAKGALVAAAIQDAKALSLRAAASIGDTPEFARWFGDYRDDHAETLRANFKSIAAMFRSGAINASCLPARDPDCRGATYAFVYTQDMGQIYLCPLFFTLPSLRDVAAHGRRPDDGTREGTILHEISHFTHAAGTEDHCYSREICAQMAQSSATRAIDNADSYQYFAEDVALAARAPMISKINR